MTNFDVFGQIQKIVLIKSKENNMQAELTRIDLKTQIPVNQLHGTGLRGTIGNLEIFKNRAEFHHHSNEKLVYQHPKIQYRILEGQFQIIGIEEGSYLLKAFPDMEQINIYQQRYYVQCQKDSMIEDIGIFDGLVKYKIVTPWLALNQDNFREYSQFSDPEKKCKYLESKFVGNILSFSKAIKYEVQSQIIVRLNVYEFGRVYTDDFNTGLLGFFGTLETNFKLPEWGWGIGKWSARGYGIMKLMEE